ncbi:MAG: hypothetical protein IT366_14340 [Candidatus Hydrogenedentes bacterium]|nr:hypothetical protein [Candidatus Hydrogenedentota bacterium]
MFRKSSVFPVIVAAALMPLAFAHPGHKHERKEKSISVAQADAGAPAQPAPGITGQGELKFKLLYKSDHLPAEAVAVLKNAHGGFAVDRRDGQGEVYFALPGAGIIEISGDLKKAKMLKTDPAMKDTNLHNAAIWYGGGASTYLVFPGNAVGKVFTTTLDGTLVNTLDAPTAETEFGTEAVNKYFDDAKNKFVPTDVTKLGDLYYIATGYSDLDYVLTATVKGNAESVAWNKLAFGGKGSEPGQFGTGHGITPSPDGKQITVADRPNAQIDRFTPEGAYVDTVSIPAGSLACDIDYTEGLAVIGCLDGPDKTKGAPIYLLKDDKIVSTLMPKEDLGLADFVHIHNATLTKVGDKLYVIAQAWNPGDFAILEQVKE